MGSKMENLLAKYGRLGIIVYFSIFFLTLFGFWTLLTTGVDIRTWSFFSELWCFAFGNRKCCAGLVSTRGTAVAPAARHYGCFSV